MRNKKADVPITLLVFMILILYGLALVSFIYNSGKIEAKIIDSRYLDRFYAREAKIDFYVNEILDRIEIEKPDKKEFVDKFRQELAKYKDKDGKFIVEELSKIQSSVNEENVEINEAENKISIKIKVQSFENLNDKISSALYTYEKTFEKEIKKSE